MIQDASLISSIQTPKVIPLCLVDMDSLYGSWCCPTNPKYHQISSNTMCLLLTSSPPVLQSVLILSHIVLVLKISYQLPDTFLKHLPFTSYVSVLSPEYPDDIPMLFPFCWFKSHEISLPPVLNNIKSCWIISHPNLSWIKKLMFQSPPTSFCCLF